MPPVPGYLMLTISTRCSPHPYHNLAVSVPTATTRHLVKKDHRRNGLSIALLTLEVQKLTSVRRYKLMLSVVLSTLLTENFIIILYDLSQRRERERYRPYISSSEQKSAVSHHNLLLIECDIPLFTKAFLSVSFYGPRVHHGIHGNKVFLFFVSLEAIYCCVFNCTCFLRRYLSLITGLFSVIFYPLQ